MSVRSRINELIDSKNLQDAIKTVEIRSGEITAADLLAITTLTQKLIDTKEPKSAIKVLEHLSKSPVFLTLSDFSLIIKGIISVGTVDQAKSLITNFLDFKIIKDVQGVLSFIEGAIDRKEYESALEVIKKLTDLSIPINERNWELIISCFNKKDAVLHSAEVIKLSKIRSKRLWQDFFTSCIKNKDLLVAINLVNEVSVISDPTFSTEIWNALLEKVVEEAELPCFEICKILDYLISYNLIINHHILTQALIRLIIGEEQSKVILYLKQLKGSVNVFVASKLLSKLIDMNLPREALELNNLIVLEVFPLITVEKLELANEKLKWILRHQQLQLIKFMKIQKTEECKRAEEELFEDEFVFL